MASKTREKLIEVARQLFALKGVAHTTMNDIARASAKGRRTIYMYFKNKKEIYNAVLEEESDALVSALHDVVDRALPADVRLREFLQLRLERYLTPASSATVRAWLKFDSRRLEKVQALARSKENSLLNGLLKEGVEEGVFASDRCRLLSEFINMALSFDDATPLSDAEIEERRRSVESFIEFIVTDITIKHDSE